MSDATKWMDDEMAKALMAALEQQKGPVDTSRPPPEWWSEAVKRAAEKTMERPEFKDAAREVGEAVRPNASSVT